MTEVAFYQLRATRLENALPRILEKALAGGHRALVIGATEERMETLNAALWTFDPASFLPHGTRRDGHSEKQPVLLSTEPDNLNGADILVLLDGVEAEGVSDYDRCLDIFDGNDTEALDAARARWQARKSAGDTVTYWEQSEGGKWEKRA